MSKFEDVAKPSRHVLRCCATCKHAVRVNRSPAAYDEAGQRTIEVSALCCNIDEDEFNDLFEWDFVEWVNEHAVNRLGDCDAYEVDLGVV